MSRLITTSVLAVAIAASAFALLAPAAHAQLTSTVDFTLNSPPSQDTANLKDAVTNVTADGYIGMYTGVLDGVSVNTYCVDFTQDIAAGQTYTDYNDQQSLTAATGGLAGGFYQGGLASVLNPNSTLFNSQPGGLTAQQRANAVASIAVTYLNSGAPTATQDAVSLAIWDIVQDGIVGQVTDTDATSAATTMNALAATIETTWIANVTAGGYVAPTNVLWIQSQQVVGQTDTQDFLTLGTPGGPGSNGTPVPNVPSTPEPGIIVTSLSMMGTLGLGLVRGRRRGKSSLTIA